MPLKQRIWAYVWLAFITCMLLGAHYYLYWFSNDPFNPFQVTKALVFASIIWCVVLLIGMVFRNAWARYGMAIWLILAMAGFVMAALVMNSQSVAPLPAATHNVMKGVAFYIIALLPIWLSNSLRRFLAPKTAGGK